MKSLNVLRRLLDGSDQGRSSRRHRASRRNRAACRGLLEGLEPRALLNGEWSFGLGSTGDDWGMGLAVDRDGFLYTTGLFSGTVDFDPDPVRTWDLTSTLAGGQNTFVAKYSPDGALLWALRIGAGGGLRSGIVVDDRDPDPAHRPIYFTGDFHGTADFGGVTLTSAGSQDIFLARLDQTDPDDTLQGANIAWAQRLGGTSPDSGLDVALDSVGHIYLTGSQSRLIAPDSSDDIFVSKLRPDGTHVWDKAFGGIGVQERGNGLAVDGNDNVYLVGDFRGTAQLGPFTLTSSDNSSDAFATRLDPATGTPAWAHRIGGTAFDNGFDVATDDDGVYITGAFTGTGTLGTFTLAGTPAPARNVFVARLDPDTGTPTWARGMSGSFGKPTWEMVTHLAADGDGNLYVAGDFSGTVDVDPNPATAFNLVSRGDQDGYAVRLDAAGELAAAWQLGGPGWDDVWGGSSPIRIRTPASASSTCPAPSRTRPSSPPARASPVRAAGTMA